MSLALGVGWRGFKSIKPGATLLRDGGGVKRGRKSPTTPFSSHDTKESQVGSMHSPGRLEEEGCSCLPRCLVWKEKWRQRLTVPTSRQPPWSCSSPELSMEKCAAGSQPLYPFSPGQRQGPASVPRPWVAGEAPQDHCGLFVRGC